MDVAKPLDWREWRRLRALHLKEQGWFQRSIAEALGVSENAVSRWIIRSHDHGPEALLAHPSPGHPPKLLSAQKQLIPEFLSHGPEAYGFRGQVWTCARIAKVIEAEFGVRYHKDHMSRLLRELQWTPQVPITRAIQRNEEIIEHWRQEVWPALQHRARHERRTLIFVDEAGFYPLPGVVRTYAPKGLTPVLHEWQTHDHLSVMGGVTQLGRVYTLARQESLTGRHSVEFLVHLLRVAATRLLVIWDGSPIHRRVLVKDFVAATRGKIWLEALPGYAPDLNPVEGLWQHLKHVEMRNLVSLDLEELHQEFHMAVGRVRQKPHLVQSFFEEAGLKIKA